MRQLSGASAFLLSALLVGACSEESRSPSEPSPEVVWHLIGDHLTDDATGLLEFEGHLVLAAHAQDDMDWENSRVRVYELVGGTWTRAYPEVSGDHGSLLELGGDLYLGGFVWESEGESLNGLARWSGTRWEAVGPERPENANDWTRTWDLITHDGECVIAAERGLGWEFQVGEWSSGEIVYRTVEFSPQFADRWEGQLVVGGYSGHSPCAPGPRILLQSGSEWLSFDGDVNSHGNCPSVEGGTFWRGQLILTGTGLPDRGSIVRTWDGHEWGILGSRTDIRRVRAFDDRLLGWSRTGDVFEIISGDWAQIGGAVPGTIEDLILVDDEIVICGTHELGGGYAAIARVGP